jgi:copper resistance protein C
VSPRPRRAGSSGRRSALIAGLLLCALAVAGPARAHSQLENTDPGDGSPVSTVPAKVTLTFDQAVIGLGTAVRVTGPGGEAGTGSASVVDRTVTQNLRPGLPAGSYTVLWRVTSADGHPVSGRFTFAAASAGAGAPAAATGDGSGTGEPSGGGSTLVWVLLGLGLLIVVAGVTLAVRRPAPAGDPAAGSALE